MHLLSSSVSRNSLPSSHHSPHIPWGELGKAMSRLQCGSGMGPENDTTLVYPQH